MHLEWAWSDGCRQGGRDQQKVWSVGVVRVGMANRGMASRKYSPWGLVRVSLASRITVSGHGLARCIKVGVAGHMWSEWAWPRGLLSEWA